MRAGATAAAAVGIVAAAVLLVVLVLVLVASHHPAAACSVHYIPNWPGSPKWLQQSGQLSTVRCP
jgi:hypothetical protein